MTVLPLNDRPVTVPVAIFSTLISILCCLSAKHIIYHMNSPRKDEEETQVSRYFRITAETAAIFNSLCALSVSIFCIWIVWDPVTIFFVFHPSHYMRAVSTIFWFLAKISIIWLYNGRLYFTLADAYSAIKTSKSFFIAINALVIIIAPLCIICGYVSVYNNVMFPFLASFSFQFLRIFYIVLTGCLVLMFSKKMLILSNDFQTHSACNSDISHPTDTKLSEITTKTPEIKKSVSHDTNQNNQEILALYMDVTTRNAILVSIILISSIFTAFCWLAFSYLFPEFERNHLTLLIPLNYFAIDSLVDSVCIYLLFHFGKAKYYSLCSKCDKQCKNICGYLSKHWT